MMPLPTSSAAVMIQPAHATVPALRACHAALALRAGALTRWLRGRAAPRAGAAVLAVLAGLFMPPAHAEHVRDLASIQGVRSNPLIGYGLVVGLDGSGDQTTQTPFTVQSLATMLTQLGITLPAATISQMQMRNVAAVMVTAVLPSFAQPGQAMDVTVSSLGNAKSLRGGTLLMTPLKGADGLTYAVAQGNVLVGGAGAASGGSKVQINHLAAGRVPDGATVERAIPTPFQQGDRILLELHESDFAAAGAMTDAINAKLGAGTASARDGRVIEVKVPPQANDRVRFVGELEAVDVAMLEPAAHVVINARTGSIVMNRTVTLEPAAVAHGNLSVTITSTPVVSQPGPLSGGQTTVTEKTDITLKQEGGTLMKLPAATNLADLVKALNALGANPGDLVAILQALKASGALRAELEVI
jgi:flagellar P-ring protein precursor FlgI